MFFQLSELPNSNVKTRPSGLNTCLYIIDQVCCRIPQGYVSCATPSQMGRSFGQGCNGYIDVTPQGTGSHDSRVNGILISFLYTCFAFNLPLFIFLSAGRLVHQSTCDVGLTRTFFLLCCFYQLEKGILLWNVGQSPYLCRHDKAQTAV